MSLALVASRGLAGIDAPDVTVEVHLGQGLPAFNIVGLPKAEVREAKDRVRAALHHARFDFPARRITVNLAPAELPKDSTRFDLPIALGILAASGQLAPTALDAHEFAGELSLSGELRPVRGALAMALGAKRAKRSFVLPAANAVEAALTGHPRVLPARTLTEVCAYLLRRLDIAPEAPVAPDAASAQLDLADVRGQHVARRALEIAAAGGHGLLLLGPPGAGKSMLAHRLAGILPPLTEDESLDVAAVHSVGSSGFDASAWGLRPVRAPHHTASGRALVGGGNPPRPGEISLAHRGVLFLDELLEFPRDALEALREPLETGRIAISRAGAQVRFPARFQIVAAMNPCPCGYLGHARIACRCTPDQVARYRGRLSGPLLDRIDLRIELPPLTPEELLGAPPGETSAAVRARVIAAVERQRARQGVINARLPAAAQPLPGIVTRGRGLLARAAARLNLSARAVNAIIAVARTIADLEGSACVDDEHLAEAIQLRRVLHGG